MTSRLLRGDARVEGRSADFTLFSGGQIYAPTAEARSVIQSLQATLLSRARAGDEDEDCWFHTNEQVRSGSGESVRVVVDLDRKALAHSLGDDELFPALAGCLRGVVWPGGDGGGLVVRLTTADTQLGDGRWKSGLRLVCPDACVPCDRAVEIVYRFARACADSQDLPGWFREDAMRAVDPVPTTRGVRMRPLGSRKFAKDGGGGRPYELPSRRAVSPEGHADALKWTAQQSPALCRMHVARTSLFVGTKGGEATDVGGSMPPFNRGDREFRSWMQLHGCESCASAKAPGSASEGGWCRLDADDLETLAPVVEALNRCPAFPPFAGVQGGAYLLRDKAAGGILVLLATKSKACLNLDPKVDGSAGTHGGCTSSIHVSSAGAEWRCGCGHADELKGRREHLRPWSQAAPSVRVPCPTLRWLKTPIYEPGSTVRNDRGICFINGQGLVDVSTDPLLELQERFQARSAAAASLVVFSPRSVPLAAAAAAHAAAAVTGKKRKRKEKSSAPLRDIMRR